MVSSIGALAGIYSAIPFSQPAAGPAPKSTAPQDTVQLSPAAQKAVAGDVDHDGDSA